MREEEITWRLFVWMGWACSGGASLSVTTWSPVTSSTFYITRTFIPHCQSNRLLLLL